jgi:phosphoesterase RecJ-like protein
MPGQLQTSSAPDALADAFASAGSILAACHVDPDGDAIGALLGLGWLLRPGSRPVALVCRDPVPADLRFLPGASEILNRAPAVLPDLIVALDASDPARLGGICGEAIAAGVPLLNLDHHITNLHYGQLNYVDPSAAATSQLLFELATRWGMTLSPEAATCLLTGCVTDTLGFRTSNTDARLLAATVALIEAGANLAEITQRTLNSRPLAVLRLWGLALHRMRLDRYVIWSEVTEAMRREAGVSDDEDGGLVSQLMSAQEARVAALFTEAPSGMIDVNLRARPGYDVARVALSLGGGGHPQAAGCSLPGPLSDVELRVLPLLHRAAARD